jgi:hypothetical protein
MGDLVTSEIDQWVHLEAIVLSFGLKLGVEEYVFVLKTLLAADTGKIYILEKRLCRPAICKILKKY